MRGTGPRWWACCVIVAIVSLVVGVGAASASKSKPVKREHVLLTFSGTGKGTYSWSEPEDDVGQAAGTCAEPSNAYTADDNYSFKWSEKFTLPEGIGSYVLARDYKVTGTDVTTQTQGTCTNGFGSPVGGDSYACTEGWNPFQEGTDYPAMSVSGPASRLRATTTGGVLQSGAPAGTNCVGASLGGAPDTFALGLKGAFTFSAAQLQRKGSLSKKVTGSKSTSCGSTTCDGVTCSTAGSTPADVPTTCSTQQSYTGELKIQILK
jgi:hypothetical protein